MQTYSNINRIIVAGHSSGAYIAHALFQDFYDGPGIDTNHLTDGKILYFLLDEAVGTVRNAVELTDASADRLEHIYGAYAEIPSKDLHSYAPDEMIEPGNRLRYQVEYSGH